MTRHWFEIDLDDASMEHGARIEICPLEPQPHFGSESAGQRVVVGTPAWRADLFDRLSGPGGSYDAAHFHPWFDGPEPCERHWDEGLGRDPWQWLAERLSDLPETLARTSLAADDDSGEVRALADHIVVATRTLGPEKCTSVEQCHRLTRDATSSVRLMLAGLKDGANLDRERVARWA